MSRKTQMTRKANQKGCESRVFCVSCVRAYFGRSPNSENSCNLGMSFTMNFLCPRTLYFDFLSFLQGNYGRYGRQMSAEDWKRGQNHGQQWDNFYGSNQSSGRLSSASSLSSVRSTSSSSEEVPVDGQLDSRPGFGIGGLGSRRQGQRPAGLPDKPLDDSARGFQNYG